MYITKKNENIWVKIVTKLEIMWKISNLVRHILDMRLFKKKRWERKKKK